MKRRRRMVRIPSMQEIDTERKRIRRGIYYRRALTGTISVLVVVAAIAVLVATLFLPILQISGDSMSPTLEHDEIVALIKTDNIDRGDLIGFYYQGKILLKRVIALPDDTVVIDENGKLIVPDTPIVSSKQVVIFPRKSALSIVGIPNSLALTSSGSLSFTAAV